MSFLQRMATWVGTGGPGAILVLTAESSTAPLVLALGWTLAAVGAIGLVSEVVRPLGLLWKQRGQKAILRINSASVVRVVGTQIGLVQPLQGSNFNANLRPVPGRVPRPIDVARVVVQNVSDRSFADASRAAVVLRLESEDRHERFTIRARPSSNPERWEVQSREEIPDRLTIGVRLSADFDVAIKYPEDLTAYGFNTDASASTPDWRDKQLALDRGRYFLRATARADNADAVTTWFLLINHGLSGLQIEQIARWQRYARWTLPAVRLGPSPAGPVAEASPAPAPPRAVEQTPDRPEAMPKSGAGWPPALRSVPAVGRATRVNEFRTSRNAAMEMGKQLKARLWGYTRYQLDKRKGSLETQEKAFMKAVEDHKADWWSQGEPGEFDLVAKPEPVDPNAQVLWQAEMSARIDAELQWLKEHHEPGRPD